MSKWDGISESIDWILADFLLANRRAACIMKIAAQIWRKFFYSN